MFDTFFGMSRLIIPDAEVLQKTGKVIAQLGNNYGFERLYLSKLTNDVLIAATARKIGAVVATNNRKDFLRIQEYIDFKIY
jgi:tRNA(fMet)-specific endonuclease VapC